MTITFPRSFPFTGDRLFQQGDLSLRRGIAQNQVGGGIQTIELADPLWIGTYQTPPLIASKRAQWQAWNLSLREGQNLFFGYHPLRQYPLAYGSKVLTLTRAGAGAFDGTATLASVTTNGIVISNLPANYVATIGDLISIPMTGSGRSLHMVLEAATASPSGNLSVNVEPFIRTTGVNIGSATVQMVRASCLMAIKPGSFTSPDGAGPQPVSFQASQSLP